jgi:DamX protein
VAATLSSEKQNPDISASEKQTGHEPENISPVEKTIEMASTSQEAIAPKTPATPEGTAQPEANSEKENTEEQAVYREKWLLSQNSSFYTIQILGVHDEGRLLRFIESDLPSPRTNLAYYQTSYRGKDWYPLLYGVYASQKDASSALKKLPTHIQKSSPWIRRLSSVQKTIQKQSRP